MNSSRNDSTGYPINGPYDPVATLSLLTLGPTDPSQHVVGPNRVRLAMWGPREPLVLDVLVENESVHVTIEGPEADWLKPFVPPLLGLDQESPTLDGPRRLREVAHRFAGLRLPRVPLVAPRLVPIVLQQLVSYRDATNGWRNLVLRHGTEVPGADGLMAPPSIRTLARLASHQFVECDILPEHGRRIVRIAREARRIEAAWEGGTAPDAVDRTCARLETIRGIGPWTIGLLRGSCLGDTDAVMPGDYGLPKQVAYFFTDRIEAADAADDDDMLRRLEPYRPHRFLVTSLIVKSGIRPPRRGPRGRLLRDRLRPRR